MAIKISRSSIVGGALVASTIGLMVLVFSVFEDAIGHGIAIASLAATTTIIVFQSGTRAGQLKTVVFSYVTAAGIGVLLGYFFSLVVLQVLIGVVLLVVALFTFNRMHPPAVAYLFGFVLGEYGFSEFFLTLMALGAFFVSLAVMVFVLEQVMLLFGLTEKEQKRKRAENIFETIEHLVDRLLPFSLIILFASILSQFLYPETLEPYSRYLAFLDWVIIGLLIVDLVFKFVDTSNWKFFLQKYWLEIIAVLPFFVIFRTFQGVTFSVEFLTKGYIVVPFGTQAFVRFLRPMARFPRFIRMLDNLDRISGLSKNK